MPDGGARTEKVLLSHGEYALSGGHEDWTSALPDGLSLTNLRLLWGSDAPGRGMEIGLADVRCVGQDDHIDLAVGEADIHVRIGVPPEHASAVASGMAALAANARYQDAVAPLTDRAGAAAPDAPIGAR
jgi:hypothetical protein